MIHSLKTILKYSLSVLFNPIWYSQLLINRDKNLWVFGGWFGKKYCDNSKILFEYVLKNYTNKKVYWITSNDEVFFHLKKKNYPVLKKGSLKSIIVTLKAGFAFISSGKDDLQKYFLNGCEIVQLWHGSPMKRIELDDKKNRSKKRESIKKVFFNFFYEYTYDYVINTSPLFVPILSSAFDINEDKILLTGFPRNDLFFITTKTNLINNIDLDFNNPSKIIYLPTFRTQSNIFNYLFEFNSADNSLVDFLERTNSVFILKPHFVEKNQINLDNKRFIFIEDSAILEINLLLKDCDVLITDFSSVYFDFLLTRKPIILAPFNFNDYLENERELYWNYFEDFPGCKAKSWQEVIDHLEFIFSTKGNCFKNGLYSVDNFNFYKDRNSNKRIVDFLINKK